MASGNKKKRRNNHNKKHAHQAVQNVPVSQEEATEELIAEDELDQQPIKRIHAEEDSDAEDKPKRKKKKKQPVSTDPADKKGQKSIRQTKREKYAQKQAEVAAASKDQLKSQCISYLSQWKHDRQNWKFMKAKQVWLYKNKFSSYLLPDSSWPVFLEYFESAKGNIRNLLLGDANKVIKQMDEWTESSSKEIIETEAAEDEKSEGPKKPDDAAYKRARDLIQCLQE